MKLRTALLGLFLGTGALTIPVVVGAAVSSCTPAQEAQMGTLGQLVLSDLAAGKTLPQIESDVAVALFGDATVTSQVVAIVNNLLQLLVNVATAPPSTSTAAATSAPANLSIPPATIATMRTMISSLQLQMAASAPKN